MSGTSIPTDQKQPNTCGRKAKDAVGKEQWKNACQRVTNILELYNMEAAICHQPFFATDLKYNIYAPVKEVRRACRFFCTKCSKEGKAALVAAGVFMTGEDGNYLQMKHLFPHNSNCESEKQTVPRSPYTVVKFDFETVIGNTYAAALDEIGKQGVQKKKLMGSIITLEDPNHDSDDRSYFPLPRTKDHHSMAHKHCMIRLFLHISVSLNLVDETAAQLFDWAKVREHIDSAKNNPWVTYPVKENVEAHLFLAEISLLFGGHNLKKEGQAQHQRCHRDVNGLEENGALAVRSKPGSVMLPLMDCRSIYMGYPESADCTEMTIKVGEYIFFEGDQPHGGYTYEEPSWHAAIHLHIDTSYHQRRAGIVELAGPEEAARKRLLSLINECTEIMSTAHAKGWNECLTAGKNLMESFDIEMTEETGCPD